MMHVMTQIHFQHDLDARDVRLMTSLLRPVDVRAQTLLLLPERLLLVPPDVAAHSHHDRLVARPFAIHRAAHRLLPLAFSDPNFPWPSRPCGPSMTSRQRATGNKCMSLPQQSVTRCVRKQCVNLSLLVASAHPFPRTATLTFSA
jgi:hypothetical protein